MGHNHTHSNEEGSGGRLLITLLLNASITVAQIIGGIISGSLSLLADAVHNASDAAAIGVSYLAQRISKKEADRKRTFGYRRAETIGALINLVTLVVISLYLIGHGVERFFNPQEVDGIVMLVVGAIAFVEDLISAMLLYRDSKHSLNIKSAFLHMVGDTLATVAVIVGSLAIMFYDFYLIDPILTILISIYILAHSYGALRDTIRVLMDSAPEGLDYDAVVETMRGIDGVVDVHHVHIWKPDERRTALEAHVLVPDDTMTVIDGVKDRIKKALHDAYGIHHTTLEMECKPCAHPNDTVIPKE